MIERTVSVRSEHVRRQPAPGHTDQPPADKLKSAQSGEWEEVVDFNDGEQLITYRLADGTKRLKRWHTLITVKRQSED